MFVRDGWGPARLEEVLHHGYVTAGGSKVNSGAALVVPRGGGTVVKIGGERSESCMYSLT